jgi:enoyl-CoA hydratase/carnithine racemase
MHIGSGEHGRVWLRINDGVAEIRLDHPEKQNCFSLELAADLRELVELVDRRDDVLAVVVTRAGPSFSAGADTTVLTDDDSSGLERLQADYGFVFDWMREEPIPVVAGADGHAAGAGASLLCYAADLRVVGEGTEIWWLEVEYGIAPLSRLVSLAADIGAPRALELLLLGEHGSISAREARDLGLVNRLVPSEAVDETAREMAGIVADYDREHDIAGDFFDVLYHARRERSGASAAYAARRRQQRERRRRALISAAAVGRPPPCPGAFVPRPTG